MLKRVDPYTTEGILFTDQYQLTMAQLYFRLGFHENLVQFDHFFRNYPDYGVHKAGYCINAGLEWFIDWLQNARFRDRDIELLRSQRGRKDTAVFHEDFLEWLRKNGNFDDISVHAIPEGRVVHPEIPLTIIQGPLAMAQILETALLNKLNYQTLIATKAARIRQQIGNAQLLLEFGIRRGPDKGVLAGARGALIGGADFTSNVGISHALGYMPKGTHAHSMVQLFLALGMTESDAFREFARLYPDDCILLVDTIDTLESGIPNAIKVFEELQRKGHQPLGIRLDSGDLAYLSIQAAKILDKAGFPEVKIVLSNELDELNIWQIITQIAEEAPKHGIDADKHIRRLTYGVGTRLITSAGDGALGGVYKLVAVWKEGKWLPAIKISEALEKTPNPGNKKMWRVYDERGKAVADLMGCAEEDPGEMDPLVLCHPWEQSKKRVLGIDRISNIEPLLARILHRGKPVYDFPSIDEIRHWRKTDMEKLDSGVRRLMNPHTYHVSVSQRLWELKQEMIHSLKK